MARSLRPQEAKVIQLLLARLTDLEVIRQAHIEKIAKSTVWTIRQRALSQGWVTERYVPDPGPLGIRRVVFQIGWPFAESSKEVTRAWAERRGVVLLWRFRDLLFSVVWEAPDGVTSGPSREHRPHPPADPRLRSLWTVEVDADSGGIPVYFDFEGAWARWAGSGKPFSYPNSLGALAGDGGPGAGPGRLPNQERLDALRLLGAPDVAPAKPVSDSPGPLGGDPDVESSSPKLRWVHRCTFPDFRRIPPLDGRGVEQVIFVTGLIRKGQRPQDLVEALFREAEVAPFLVTFGEERLLLGLLAPRPPKAGGHSVPVLKVLEERLTEVEIQRDSISTLVPVIDHRYGGLLESVDAPQLPRPKRGS